jgi:beta-lactamase class A
VKFLHLIMAAILGFGGDQTRGTDPGQALADARLEVEQLIADSRAAVAVAWRPLDAGTSDELLINATTTFHAASTMKVPVMIELFTQAAAGRLDLDELLPVLNRFHSIVDGSEYRLSAADDSDQALYGAMGEPRTLRALCDAMITTSSNLAANLLIERLGPARIQDTMNRSGAGGIKVLRGVEDQKAFDRGMNNTTTAEALLMLFWKLGRGEIVTPAASAEMVAILERQKFNDAIPRGLPPGTRVAHKTGTITAIHHDAGIVLGRRPYVLVVLVRGIEDQQVSARLIADIARVMHRLAD